MKSLPRVDVAIAGGGWAGLLMAKELGARTGLSVVVLERGEPRKAIDYFNGMDELDYAIRLRMMQDASRETVTFRNTSNDRALPVRQFASFLPGTGVGGAGEHWKGITPRFLPDCFEIHTRTVERYGAGAPSRQSFAFKTGALPTRSWSLSTLAPRDCWAFRGKRDWIRSKARIRRSIRLLHKRWGTFPLSSATPPAPWVIIRPRALRPI